MTFPSLDLAAVGPILFVGVGSMLVLLGEVLLSRVGHFMNHRVTPSLVGAVLAATAMVFLGLAALMSLQQAAGPSTAFFNPDNPMFQVDRFSATFSAALSLASLLCCALAIAYLDAMRINHGEYYALLLFATAGMPVGGYDLICIGTPPDSHLKLALNALQEKPRAFLVEKPLCGPDLELAQDLLELAQNLRRRGVARDLPTHECCTKLAQLLALAPHGVGHDLLKTPERVL